MANIISWIKPYRELTLESETVYCKPYGKFVENIQEVEDDQIETEINEDVSEEQEMVDSCEESEFESGASEDSYAD
ncbi:hypothetical protein FQA39_LY13147 [Lamprigera yunnana]|nr:hypothetical protein FQA39_LY13147 [Lamprigera yunnana]